jgi:hypothetical protein
MSLENRLKKLEAARLVSKDGLCICPVGAIRLYYPGNEPPADMPLVETCDECGGERRVIRIEVTGSREEVTTPLPKHDKT